ncbi:MAG: VanW family protein [Butyricicoccus sp.]
MDEKDRNQRELSLEDIIEEVHGEHASYDTGNSALDAMLRARKEAPGEMPQRAEKPPVYTEPSVLPDCSMPQPELFYAQPEESGKKAPIQEDEFVPQKKSRNRKKSRKSRSSGAGKKVASVLIGLVVLLAGASFGYTYMYSGVHFGVQAGAVKVGGMSLADARKTIDSKAEDLLNGEAITLTIYDTDYKIEINQVATGLDSKQSAQDAYDYTREGGVMTRVGHTIRALFGGYEVPLSVSVDDDALGKRLDEISDEALTEPVEPSWTLEEEYLVIDTGKPGVEFDRDEVAEQVTERIRTMDFEAFEVKVTIRDPEKIDIEAISAEAQAEPKNATVDKTDGKTILPSVDGVEFDLEEAKEIVGDGREQTYKIPVKRTPAEVTADKLAEVLFSDTLVSTSTNLNAGNKPRTNNVRLACEHINGTILNPGDEFSYNNVVGQRTAERGFQSAGAYANGQVIDEVGGGVCQPSSTLYMAVLRADLEVTERHNHSFTVAYTPLGEDATVSWGGPDFRFKNNTKYPIKIIASQSGSSCNMKIIGTKTSDKKVTLNTEVLSTIEYQTVEKTDSSLAPGERQTSQTGTTGYKTVTYKTITENGQSTTVKANTSSYQKRDKIVLVGPAASAPSTPSNNTPTETATSNNSNAESGDPEAQ